jgi:hypothetical protein
MVIELMEIADSLSNMLICRTHTSFTNIYYALMVKLFDDGKIDPHLPKHVSNLLFV